MQEIPVVKTADAKKLRRPISSLNISFLPAAAREGRQRKVNEQKVTKEAKKGKKECADLTSQLLLVLRQRT
jgi:hypothetical protein